MKKWKVLTALVMLVLFMFCSVQKEATVPPKVTQSSDIPVVYFQNRGPKEENKEFRIQLQPEDEIETSINNEVEQINELLPEKEQQSLVEKTEKEEKQHQPEKSENKTENKFDEQIKSNFKAPQITNNQQTGEKKFSIVSGSFIYQQNAERLLKKLKTDGYSEASILKCQNKFFRVIVYSVDEEKEAREFLSDYRQKKPQYNDAWLFYEK